jgi:GNAT superfamily N-acetyltransferase
MSLEIRPATPADVPALVALIQALADYEKLAHEVTGHPEDLERALFGDRPYAEAVLAWVDDTAVGMALFFHNFSTFLMKPGIYLEDIFVQPAYRGRGIGKALLVHVGQLPWIGPVAASSGACWTGTPRRSSFTSAWGQRLSPSGRSVG